MSKTDAAPAADRGSECNDLLGLDPERAAFEAWATEQGLTLNRHRHSYAANATAWCWDAWQSGRAAERERWRDELAYAEAALADIGDADREPGDDLAWCEARAAEALPRVRAALKA